MFSGFPQAATLHIGSQFRGAGTGCPRVFDRVLMNGHTDTIIGLPFPTLGISLGIGVAQFLLGQVRTA